MSDLLTEVDEMMRQERMEKFWHENKTYIITFIALTIIMTGVFSAYRSWDANVKTTQTAELFALMEAENYPQNILEADLTFRTPLKAITLMGAAGTFMTQDKQDEAEQLYTRVAKNFKISDDLRHLAIITLARLGADKENANADTLLTSLEPTLSDKSPWQPHARIEAAVINANLKGDFETAKTHLNAVLDTENIPPTLYARAQNLHHVYSLKSFGKAQQQQTQ